VLHSSKRLYQRASDYRSIHPSGQRVGALLIICLSGGCGNCITSGLMATAALAPAKPDDVCIGNFTFACTVLNWYVVQTRYPRNYLHLQSVCRAILKSAEVLSVTTRCVRATWAIWKSRNICVVRRHQQSDKCSSGYRATTWNNKLIIGKSHQGNVTI